MHEGKALAISSATFAAPVRAGSSPTAATVLAFDYGTRRIGVAVGDLGLRSAHPLLTLDARERTRSAAAIAALIDEWRPVRLVVGVPFALDGSEHAMTRSARAFGRALGKRHALPVSEVDERLSSVEAEAQLREAGAGREQRAAMIDAQAAFIILRAFLAAPDSQAPEAGVRGAAS